MHFDEIIHGKPKLYRKKVRLVIKLKKLAYMLLCIDKETENIANQYRSKRLSVLEKYFKGKLILDVGCGRGDFIRDLKNKYGCICIGIDISRNMVLFARNQNSKSSLIMGTSSHLPFKDDCFDVVSLNHVFHHLPPSITRKTLDEAKRVAKEVVLIDDTCHFEKGFLKYFSIVFWKVTDAGYKYRTYNEWKEFLEDDDVVEEWIGRKFSRLSFFVINAKK